MSSRWISTSLSACDPASSRLTCAWTALTSEDLPMPRAPQSSALLAGRPGRSGPCSPAGCRGRDRCPSGAPCRPGSRAERARGGAGAGCQTKASAAAKSGFSRRGRRKALEALGDALQKRGDGGIGVSGLAHGSNPETLGFPLAGGVTRVTQARLHSLFPASLRNRSHLLST